MDGQITWRFSLSGNRLQETSNLFFFLAYSFVSYQRKGGDKLWVVVLKLLDLGLRGVYCADRDGQGRQVLFLEMVGIASCSLEVTAPEEPITAGLANVLFPPWLFWHF